MATRSTPSPRTRPLHLAGAVSLAVVAILVGGALGSWWPTGDAAEHVVSMPGDSFSPAALTITAGDSVVWRFTDDHTVTSKGGPGPSFDSGIKASGEFRHTFPQAGTYPYVCVLHDGMNGTVVVTPATGAPAPPGSPAAVPPLPAGPNVPAATPAARNTALGAPGTPVTGDAPGATGSAATAGSATGSVITAVRAIRTGRRLSLRVRLAAPARITVTLARAGTRRRVATRSLPRGTSTIVLRTARLSRGRLTAIVRAGSDTRTRPLAVR